LASAFAHAFAAATLAGATGPGWGVRRLLCVGVVCSVLPDLDVLGFPLGIAYEDALGHRGLSHSLAFAAVVAAVATPLFFRAPGWQGLRGRVAVYLFVVTASHGIFDAMTNGGLGVAFFSPFDTTRYFLPFTPVQVSPIGVAAFFSERSIGLLVTEMVWIALPWSLFSVAVLFVRRRIEAVRDSSS
jgi:inner membrane protein